MSGSCSVSRLASKIRGHRLPSPRWRLAILERLSPVWTVTDSSTSCAVLCTLVRTLEKSGAGVTSAVLSTDEVTLEKSAFLSTLIAAIPVHRGVSRVREALLSMDRAAVKPARSRMSATY
ncbi:hypothetical protein XAUB_26070 [Xanthomonas citri pv. aurantifolii str. ICPB 11122]|nr:hypothetical protein XAUB_26070 [Xanthomonas citri pv. aurantifolii str. ICPB 11122]